MINDQCDKQIKISTDYDNCLDYMDFVFQTYGKELQKIQISEQLTLKDANRICPFDTIAIACSRLMNADVKDIKRITNEEVAKLKEYKRK